MTTGVMANIHLNTDVKKTILVVDDSHENRFSVVQALADSYSVIEAESKGEALELLRSQPINAVLINIDMPENNDCVILHEMLTDERLAHIPVIAVTDSNEEALQSKALRCGVQDLISRPFTSALLQKRIGNLISLREAMMAVRKNEQQRDGLTGLFNRVTFIESVKQLVRGKDANKYLITCLDIDSFKVINDRFGHDAGDDLLKYVAKIFDRAMQQYGGLACRDSADKFFSVLPNEKAVPDSATDSFFNELQKCEFPINVDVHIGRYVIDDPNVDVNLMMDHALMAVCSVKGSAEKRIAYFTENMRAAVLRQRELEIEMRPALASGQFVLYFQPQYNYSTGAMTGAEALVRWNHPQKGIISPCEFIPLFEKNDFIAQLDLFIWEQACRYQREWIKEGIAPIPISVNISRHDLKSLDLTKVIPALVKKYGLSPQQLHLEITESAYIDSPHELIKIVEKMKSLGFLVEMDDFGAGYSSLNILKDVPVDTLKLDMKFIGESKNSSRGGSILSSVIRMAHWLKMPVIAEGVETNQQAEYLKSIGCSLMQGYYFNKPLPEHKFRQLLKTQKLGERQYKSIGTDVHGALDFFDASTQSTLLFNSFVGGAVIAEYDGTKLELLRINDRFFDVIGYTRDEYKKTDINILNHFNDDCRTVLMDALTQAAKTGDETACELCSKQMLPDKEEFYTMNRIRFLAQYVERFVFYISIENITERKMLQKRTQDLTEELGSLIRSTPCGMYKFSLEDNGRITFVSDSMLEMLGYTRKEFSEQFHDSGYELVYEEDRYIWDKKLEDIKKSDMYEPREFRILTKEGKLKWVFESARRIHEPDGKTWFSAVIMDIDSRKALEKEAQSETSRAEALVANIPGGAITLAIKDRVATCEYFSDGFCKMIGYSREETQLLVNDDISLLIHSDDRQRVIDATRQSFLTQSELNEDYRLLHKNGRYIWVNITANPVKGENDTVRFYASNTDITQHMRNEEALRAESQRNQLYIEQNNLAIINYEYETDTLLVEAHDYNKGYQKLSFPNFYSVVSCSDAVEPNSRIILQNLLDTVRTNPSSGTVECQQDVFGTGYRWASISYSGITDNSGKVTRLVGLVSDIQQEKEREMLLKQLSNKAVSVPTYEPHLVADIFAYLSTEKSTEVAIQHVLSVVGNHYQVSRVYIFENSENGTHCSNTFEWCAEGITPEIHNLQNLSYAEDFENNIEDNFDKDGLFLCRDISSLPDDQREFLAAQGIHSMLQCAINNNGKFLGYIGFDDCNGTREWTSAQFGTLSILSRVIGLYLFKGRDQERVTLSEDFMASLDESTSFISIVDVTTDEIVYSNPTFEQAFGKRQPGVPCYKQVLNRDSRCEDCPISAYKMNHRSTDVELNALNGSCYLGKSSVLHLNGREVFMNTYVDITARKNMEKSLQERLEETAAVIRQSGRHVFRYNIKDDSAQSITGGRFFGTDKPIENCTDVILNVGLLIPESRDIMLSFFGKMSRGEPKGHCDVRLRAGNGKVHWYHAEFTMINKDGQPDHAIVSFYDTTIRTGFNQSLLKPTETQLYYTNQINNIVPSMIILDAIGIPSPPVYIAGTLARDMGYTDEELNEFCRNEFRGFIYEQDAKLLAEKMSAVIHGDEDSVKIEYRAYDKGGSLHWISATAIKTRDADGGPAVLTNIVDITSQKEADELQRITAEENAIVIRQSGKYVLSYNIKTGHATNLIDASELLDIPAEVDNYHETLIKNGVVLQDSYDALSQLFDEMNSGKASGSCELHTHFKDETIEWVHVDFSMVYNENGIADHAIISFYNTTSQREIEQLHRQMKTLTDTVPGGILIYDYHYDDGNVFMKFFNDEICRMSGYTHDEYLELSKVGPWSFVYKEDEHIVKEQLAEVANGVSKLECEYRAEKKNGEIRWMHLLGRAVDSGNGIALIYIVLLDITDRKKTEAHLKFHNSCLEKVDESLSAGTIINGLGLDSPLLYVSGNIEKFIGYTADEFKEMHKERYKRVVHPEDFDRVCALNKKHCIERPEHYETEFRIVRKDGSVFWATEKGTLLPDFDGQPAYLSVFVDITKQMASIHENAQLLRIVAKQSQKYLVMYDFAADEMRPMDDNINVESNIMQIFRSPQDYFDNGIVSPESYDEMMSCYAAMRSGAPDATGRFRAKSLDGKMIWMECTVSTVFDNTGKPSYALASFANITDSYEKELAFERYQAMINSNAADKTFYFDYNLSQGSLEADGGNMNLHGLADAAGRGYSHCIKEIAERYVIEEDRQEFSETFEESGLLKAFANGTAQGEMDLRIRTDSKGKPIYARISYQMVTDPYSSCIRLLLSCIIIDKQKRAELEMLRRAQTDEVTGVLNRATFIEKATENLKSADEETQYAFVMLDVDHFKDVNDTFGHVEGDKLLHDISSTLQSTLIETDIFGRLGGDEFGMLIGGFADLKSLDEKIVAMLKATYRELGEKNKVSASIGVSLFPKDGGSIEELYAKSDIALYQVKENGRNGYLLYNEKMPNIKNVSMLLPIDSAYDEE